MRYVRVVLAIDNGAEMSGVLEDLDTLIEGTDWVVGAHVSAIYTDRNTAVNGPWREQVL